MIEPTDILQAGTHNIHIYIRLYVWIVYGCIWYIRILSHRKVSTAFICIPLWMSALTGSIEADICQGCWPCALTSIEAKKQQLLHRLWKHQNHSKPSFLCYMVHTWCIWASYFPWMPSKNNCRCFWKTERHRALTVSKLQKCSEFQGWRFARSHEFVGTISGATSRSPWMGHQGMSVSAHGLFLARCVNETTCGKLPEKTDLPPTKIPKHPHLWGCLEILSRSRWFFLGILIHLDGDGTCDSDRFSMAVFVHLNWPDWYNVRPPR